MESSTIGRMEWQWRGMDRLRISCGILSLGQSSSSVRINRCQEALMRAGLQAALLWVGFCVALAAFARAADDVDWPRFRGPNGQGIAAAGAKPPTEFGPAQNVRWRADVPSGVSSPIVTADHVFLTAVSQQRHLLTLCLDRRDGKVLWEKRAPESKLEPVHSFSSAAAATPASDGRRVYVYFGSYGLLVYDATDGKELWRAPLTRPGSEWGMATSPIVVGDRVIQVCDGNGGSYITALDRETGKIAWNVPRLLFRGGWSTPVVHNADATDTAGEIIVLGAGRLIAYDPQNGRERWTVVGFPVNPIMTPVLGDGVLFAGVSGMGDPGDRVGEIPDFPAMLELYDKNNDGRISPGEIPNDAGIVLRKEVPHDAPGNFLSLHWLVGQVAHGKDSIGPLEWKLFEVMSNASGPTLMAIRPGGSGNVTDTNVLWKTDKNVPEIPTPLYYQGRLYLVRDGGRIACLSGATGGVVFHGRLEAPGQYVASPVAADGRIYFCSEPGTVSVLKAGDRLELLAANPLGERIVATPAIVGDTIYVRTASTLYAFARTSP
jgi:outer membrane protein assembly factor BamB